MFGADRESSKRPRGPWARNHMGNPSEKVISKTKKNNVETYINQIECLPAAPSHMLRMLAIFKEPDPDIDEVVKLVSRDPSLTTQVMKLCNSARFRGETSVTDMFEAISRLGFYEVYRVVMMVSAKHTISLENIESVLEVEALCRHSMATGVAAGVVAKTVGAAADFAFIAGLLHDVGKIALASEEGTSYGRLFRNLKGEGKSLCAAEKDHFGFDHSEVGSALLNRWGMPPEVVQAVKYHHHLEEADDSAQLTGSVALADLLANHVEKKSAADLAGTEDFAQAVAVLKLAPEAVTGVIAEVNYNIKRMND